MVTMAPLDLKAPTAFKLNNGTYIPAVGLGTWQSQPGEVGAAVKAAIEVGYRHIDCARAYKNQREVGDALRSAFKSGIVKREDLWITTKLWNTEHHEVPEALERCLTDLQLDYIDLYLIHWPVHFKTGETLAPKPEDFAPLDIKSTWQAMEKLVDSGKVRAIGLSNFSAKKVNDLLSYARIVPAVDQVECHPMWQQRKLQDALAAHDIHMTAYSPIGSPGTSSVRKSVLDQPVIKELADKHNKTPAQIALRWGLQRGHSVIPKSTHKERLQSNLQIFDFSLSDEDIRKIGEIEQERLIKGTEFTNDSTSPYKNEEALWDGEW